jgi:hypothetical protein
MMGGGGWREQTIYHDPERPSAVLLPTVDLS